jgi:SPP1 family predicted phage head-tail adaptor
MDAGLLDRRITIERATETTDAVGGVTREWGPLATVWAQVLPISDGERWRAEEVAAHVTHRFRIRWGAGVLPTDRIVYEGRIFDLSGVKEIGRREGQELTGAARAEATS